MGLPDDKIALGELNIILHSVFFAYQQRARNLLRENEDVVLASMVSDFLARNMTGLSDRLDGKTIEEKLRSFAELLVNSKIVSEADIVKHRFDYEFRVEGCTFALTMQDHKNGMDVACPWGAVAASIASRTSGKNFRPAKSRATDLGSSTEIIFCQ